MNLLAIETTSVACSVALSLAGQTTERHELKPREHTHLLLPMISGLLGEAGVIPADLDAIVLGNGPGSFIGMRIGASVAQGLAFAAGLKIAPVSSLAAIAAEVHAEHGATNVAVAQDARMNEVYFAEYRIEGNALPQLASPEAIYALGVLPISGTTAVAGGAAWQQYPGLLDANRDRIASVAAVHYPRAQFLLAFGQQLVSMDHLVEPAALEPAYLRSKVAEPPAA